MAVVWDFSRTSSTSSTSTIILNKDPLFTASKGAPLTPDLEFGALSALLPTIHTSYRAFPGALRLDQTAPDGVGSTAEVPGLTADAVDTAAGLAAARHRLRRKVRHLAARPCP